MVISLPSISLIYALLLLAPGFITYKLSKKYGKITSNIDNFDKAIYTVLGSGASLSLSFAVLTFFTGILRGVWAPEMGLIELVSVYSLTIPISGLLGYLSGIVLEFIVHADDDIRNESVWQLIAKNSDEPTQVTVLTTDDKEIWGEIRINDSDPHGQDLFLAYPLKRVRDSRDNIIAETELGDYVFISQEAISQIYYETEVNV